MTTVCNVPQDILIQRIADNYDQSEICEVLRIDCIELLEAFSERIMENLNGFPSATTDLDYGDEDEKENDSY